MVAECPGLGRRRVDGSAFGNAVPGARQRPELREGRLVVVPLPAPPVLDDANDEADAFHGASRQASPDARPVVAGKAAGFVAAPAANRVMASRTVENSRWASVRALASLGPAREAR